MMNSGGNTDMTDPRGTDQGGSEQVYPNEQEGLRLIQAFRSIPDSNVRRTILELLENVSRRMAQRRTGEP